jgi:hypothetical protein
MSSCFETVDNGVIIRHYTGDVTMGLTSANNGGLGYQAPVCSKHTAAARRGAIRYFTSRPPLLADSTPQ